MGAVSRDIANAVKAAIDLIPAMPTVVVRQIPVAMPEDTALPMILVAPGADHEEFQIMGGTVFMTHEILVNVVYPGNTAVALTAADDDATRQTILRALRPSDANAPPVLLGVPSVWNVDITEIPGESIPTFQKNISQSGIFLVYHTTEAAHE